MAISSFRIDKNWKDAILEIIKTHEEETITLQQIYAKMKNHPLVKEYHMKPWCEGGQLKYQCWIRKYLSLLVGEGKIYRVSKGTYILHRSK
jgi:hypothetical protein